MTTSIVHGRYLAVWAQKPWLCSAYRAVTFAVTPVFDDITVTHWAACPTTGDPILLTCRDELVPVEQTLVAVFSQEELEAVRRQYEQEVSGSTEVRTCKEASGGE